MKQDLVILNKPVYYSIENPKVVILSINMICPVDHTSFDVELPEYKGARDE